MCTISVLTLYHTLLVSLWDWKHFGALFVLWRLFWSHKYRNINKVLSAWTMEYFQFPLFCIEPYLYQQDEFYNTWDFQDIKHCLHLYCHRSDTLSGFTFPDGVFVWDSYLQNGVTFLAWLDIAWDFSTGEGHARIRFQKHFRRSGIGKRELQGCVHLSLQVLMQLHACISCTPIPCRHR